MIALVATANLGSPLKTRKEERGAANLNSALFPAFISRMIRNIRLIVP
jgi:hypothetical protein